MKHKIYKITNKLNSTVYVEYTSKSLSWRLGKHFEEAASNPSSSRKLFEAINTIGKENFAIYLLYSSKDKKSTLGIKEQKFIDQYNSIIEGYDSRKGGGGIHNYKVRDTTGAATKAARKVNLSKKRPGHSEFMKAHPSKVDNNHYQFIHKTGVTFSGTRHQLINSFPSHNISMSEMGMVINRKYNTHREWGLKNPL